MKKLLAIIIAGLFVFGCSDHPTDPFEKELKTINPDTECTEVTQDRTDPLHILADEYANAIEYNFIATHRQFALKCFKEIEDAEPGDKNIFFSPLSLQIALTMLLNGAQGSTYDAIAQTLEFQDFTLEEINQQFLNLVRSLEGADHSVTFHNANSAWIDAGFPVYEDYQQRIIDYFSAQVENINLHTPEAVEAINNWASEHTNGQITQILDQIPAEVVMYLINALYFAGEWIYKFDPRLTVDDTFYLPDGSFKYVPMMENTGRDYYYLFTDDFDAARMPYGRNIFAMYVFLPDEENSVDNFIDGLNTRDWEDWMYSFEHLKTLVDRLTYLKFICRYPKFRFGYDINLKDVLTSLGMGIAYNSGLANFYGISPVPTFVSKVFQKTSVDVNELGTEAAAISGIQISVGLPPPIRFEVNRPFFFTIQDDRTGAILFMGKIVEPVIE